VFNWTDQCELAFTTLKNLHVQAPILVYPSLGLVVTEFSLHTDASGIGLGAVLVQDGHVIAALKTV
jgi:hypothetical protein